MTWLIELIRQQLSCCQHLPRRKILVWVNTSKFVLTPVCGLFLLVFKILHSDALKILLLNCGNPETNAMKINFFGHFLVICSISVLKDSYQLI